MVRSSQAGVHPRLGGLLRRYGASHWSNPLHRGTCQAFEALQALLTDNGRPLVLDSGCGTGESTRQLARRFTGAYVIGVDKSSARLSRQGVADLPRAEGNAIWLRGELGTFWRLALRAGWRLQRHYLFYPNPWPKPGHLQRRWHAHPVFADLLRLGGRLEMRTNWRIYADEFAFALNGLAGLGEAPCPLNVQDPVSPFERKYRDSGHRLYAVVANL